VVDGAALAHSLLLETGPDRRFSHLELATRLGLLTLHPEPGGTLHGNALAEGGLRHVVGLPWDPDGLVIVEGSTVAAAAAAHLLAAVQPAGAAPAGFATSHPVLRVRTDLSLATGLADVELAPDGRYVLADEGPLLADADSLPFLPNGRSWPLEETA